MRTTLRRPLVTVGITTYDEAENIARCLASVQTQTLGAGQIEVLIADDGSTDQTLSIARSFRRAAGWANFRILRQRNTGNASTGRNRIIEKAAGTYLFLMDGDDYLGPEALAAMTRSARKHRSDVVSGRYVGVDRSAPNPLGVEDLPERHEYHPGWLNSLHIQKLFRTRFLCGLDYRFNPKLNYANDHPFMISALLNARRISFVHDVDCYFITLAGTGAHVSRASLPPVQQLRFLHDCFGLLAMARGQGGRKAQLAGKIRADYWNRLLKLHLPMLLLRKTDEAEAGALAEAAANLAEIYGAQTSRSRLAPGAQKMLEALRTGDGAAAVSTAREVREEASQRPEGAQPLT